MSLHPSPTPNCLFVPSLSPFFPSANAFNELLVCVSSFPGTAYIVTNDADMVKLLTFCREKADSKQVHKQRSQDMLLGL